MAKATAGVSVYFRHVIGRDIQEVDKQEEPADAKIQDEGQESHC